MRASRGGGESHRRWRVVTDEPGYPCIAQRWTGSDDARRRPGGASRTVLLPEPLNATGAIRRVQRAQLSGKNLTKTA